MTFNPLAACLASGVAGLVPEPKTVIEFGNQTFTVNNTTLDFIGNRFARQPSPKEELARLRGIDRLARKTATATFYRSIGFSEYCAIDVNDRYGSIVMDLNKPLRSHYGFKRRFELSTNNGTGEHIFDQAMVFRNLHDVTEPGGIIVCALPFLNFVNHGFYSFHPVFFGDLALANAYELLAIGFADRWARGTIAVPPVNGADPALPRPLLLAETTLPMDDILGKPPELGAGMRRLWRLWRLDIERRFNLGPSRGGHLAMARSVQRLMRRSHNIHAVAIMRKTREAEFRAPFQGMYRESIQDEAIRRTYRDAV